MPDDDKQMADAVARCLELHDTRDLRTTVENAYRLGRVDGLAVGLEALRRVRETLVGNSDA